jgi:hypothetical protein
MVVLVHQREHQQLVFQDQILFSLLLPRLAVAAGEATPLTE